MDGSGERLGAAGDNMLVRESSECDELGDNTCACCEAFDCNTDGVGADGNGPCNCDVPVSELGGLGDDVYISCDTIFCLKSDELGAVGATLYCNEPVDALCICNDQFVG